MQTFVALSLCLCAIDWVYFAQGLPDGFVPLPQRRQSVCVCDRPGCQMGALHPSHEHTMIASARESGRGTHVNLSVLPESCILTAQQWPA